MKKLLVAILSLTLAATGVSGCHTSTTMPQDTIQRTLVSVDTFVFAKEPAGAKAGMQFTTQPIVHVVDQQGKIDTRYDGLVTLSVASNLNPSGGTLSGVTTEIAVSGVATFTDLSIDLAGNGYALMASNGSLTPSLSAVFNVA